MIEFSVALSFGIIFVYGAELFPTTYRSQCLGLAASLGRATGIFITWLNDLLLSINLKPVLFYSCFGILILFLLKWLPETYGENLKDFAPEEDNNEKKASVKYGSTTSLAVELPSIKKKQKSLVESK